LKIEIAFVHLLFTVDDLRFTSFMVSIALVEPEIPPNTGNIARLCAATRTPLHIVGQPGFRMDDRTLRRAGLDYWPEVELYQHLDFDALRVGLQHARFVFLTTKAVRAYTDWQYEERDCLVFGRETRGLPDELLRANAPNCLRIPVVNPKVRSLNLATAVAIVLFEALRQLKRF
jgi:tRNA (cytidine/uridine-2'-O-)-methyltransferase